MFLTHRGIPTTCQADKDILQRRFAHGDRIDHSRKQFDELGDEFVPARALEDGDYSVEARSVGKFEFFFDRGGDCRRVFWW